MRKSNASLVIASLLAITIPAVSQTPKEIVDAQMREMALDHLLSERDSLKALERAIEAARKAGVSEQAILEARFLYHIDQVDDTAIAALLPDFIRQQKQFNVEDSAIFAVEEDWLAVVEYVKALDALEKGDKEGFKTHIKEAFWLGPRQATAFAPQIERLRHDEAMSAIIIDFNTSIPHLNGNDSSTLASCIENHKALMLHFWSPKSTECEATMPDFAKTAAMLDNHGFAVASISQQASPLARAMAQPYQTGNTGLWAVDSPTHALARILRVQKLPTMTLINPQGKVLFSGDPTDDQFWAALKKIDPSVKRPKADGDYSQ